MPKYNFNLRNPKAQTSTPINFVIRWGNRRLVYPTGESIEPRFWCNSPRQRNFQRAKQTSAFPEHPELNERLDALLSTTKAEFRKFTTDNDREPEVQELRDVLNLVTGRSTEHHSDLLEFISHYIERTKDMVNSQGKTFNRSIYQMNLVTLKRLKEFVKATHRSVRVPFRSLGNEFIADFTIYLTRSGMATNTVGRYIKYLRKFIHAAAKEGLEINPRLMFRGAISSPAEEADTIYLNEQELKDLYDLDLSDRPRLARSRDLFLIGAWTGLRFRDLTKLNPDHIDGDRIRIRASKTGHLVVIPLHPIVKAIMAKYADGLPSSMSNQKLNMYIKEVGSLVPSLSQRLTFGISKGGVRKEVAACKWEKISTHTARRSFASNLYRRKVPTHSIMAVTGHRTESAFLRYIRLDKEQHADMIAGSVVFMNNSGQRKRS